MHRFDFPATLPPCGGPSLAVLDHFPEYPLGLALPDSLAGFMNGLASLESENPKSLAPAMGMALWGMQFHPLAPDMAAWAARFSGRGLPLAPPLAGLVERLLRVPCLTEEDGETMDTWYALARQDDRSLILRFLTLVLRDPAKGLAWLGHCWQDLLFQERPELARAALDMYPWDEATLPLRQRLEAEWSFHRQSPDEALGQVAALDPGTWGLWRAYAGGELLLRTGDKGRAKGILARLWKAVPWQVNLTLKLHDLFNPPPPAGESGTGSVAVLLYSWNKADLLADTLGSLHESEIGMARIFALDNGSTDHTQDVLRAATDRFGPDRFHVETLPVNVGAPAARNWLLSLEGVRSRHWAAFLDDDVILPEEWLLHLLGAAGTQPGVGAAGCRITAATPPYGLQSADYNLLPRAPGPTEPGRLPNRVLAFDNTGGAPDVGLFNYTRPCLSVSGCCHLISMRAIEKAGGFDLRYTPSQFDDLDRDLQSALHSMPAVYAGGLAVRHVQHSSLAKSQTARQIDHVMGNKFKLDTKYSDEELAGLARGNAARLKADLEAKHASLVDRLGAEA
jgi:GT2 family glycosyltransferase